VAATQEFVAGAQGTVAGAHVEVGVKVAAQGLAGDSRGLGDSWMGDNHVG